MKNTKRTRPLWDSKTAALTPQSVTRPVGCVVPDLKTEARLYKMLLQEIKRSEALLVLLDQTRQQLRHRRTFAKIRRLIGTIPTGRKEQ